MTKTVVLIGSLDTKGAEFAFVKELIEREGLHTLVVDFGVMGPPAFEPDIGREEVAAAGGRDLDYFADGDHKDEAMQTMAAGVASIVRRLHRDDRLDGVLGMGGSGGTSVATAGMRALPVGVPKVMVSTMAGGDVSSFVGTRDIVLIPSIVDVAGINGISGKIFANAAGAIAGMVKLSDTADTRAEMPVITASMNGNTTPTVDYVRGVLEGKGYEVLVFHTTGIGGRTMEDLITDGLVSGCLDITTTELADEVAGGVGSSGPDRCRAAPHAGIPTLLVPGCVDMIGFHAVDTVPEGLLDRTRYEWNPNTTLVRTNVEDNRRVGEMIAAAANESTGPMAVMLPLKGVSMLASPGGRFWDPEADEACFQAIRSNLDPRVPLHEIEGTVADPVFAEAASDVFVDLLSQAEPAGHPASGG